MKVTWSKIKKLCDIKIANHIIERCQQRGIGPNRVYDAVKYGTKIYFFDGSDLITKHISINVGVVQRKDRLVTALKFADEGRHYRKFLRNNDTFIFEEM